MVFASSEAISRSDPVEHRRLDSRDPARPRSRGPRADPRF